MSYLIKTVGIDLAPVSSGLSVLSMRADTWETSVLDAGIIHIPSSYNRKQTQFSQHIAAAGKIVNFVKKNRPDLVGIEEYTNQPRSFVSFSMAQLGGIVRLLLWQCGYRQLLITPSRISKMIVNNYDVKHKKAPTGKALKEHTVKWVRNVLKVEFAGSKKACSDMADATIYALIAAVFFSIYWLRKEPPMTVRQKDLFCCKPPLPQSPMILKGTWNPTGLLDIPYRYLIRNINTEPSAYTPEWVGCDLAVSENQRRQDVLFVGDGTPEYEVPRSCL